MKKTILTLFFTLLLALPAVAQTGTATLGGRIVDENGPLEGVTVVAIHQQTNVQYYATTGRGGWWQMLDVLPGGPYILRIHYFGYDPLTVRGLFAYAGQNTVVDADLEAGTTRVHVNEAATSLRLGEAPVGGAVGISPLRYNLVEQEVYAPVVFDVRRETSLDGVDRQWTVPTGSNRFHGSAYGYYGSYGAGGLTVAAPVGGEDYQLFGGLQYEGGSGFSGAGRFDARMGGVGRLELTGGLLSGETGWASAGLTSPLLDGAASNRAVVGWNALGSQWTLSDDFTLGAGPQRLLAGIQAIHVGSPLQDAASSRFDFYVQDVLRAGRRMTLQAGVRFSFPFAFSPRVSLSYDVLGTGALVMRAGTAVYGVHGEGSVWKNLAAVDTRLPLGFILTLEGIYGQSWRRPFYISARNVLDSRYALTARLERPFADGAWAVASYTRSDGVCSDRVIAGFSYRAAYLGHFATTASLLYSGYAYEGADPASSMYPAPQLHLWANVLEARLSQDLSFQAAGRDHVLQLTAYLRRGQSGLMPSGQTQLLAGLRYLL